MNNLHAALLKDHEQCYDDVEKTLRIALRILLLETQKRTPLGLDPADARSSFFKMRANAPYAFTPDHLLGVYNVLRRKYTTQLHKAGIALPNEQEVVQSVTRRKQTPSPVQLAEKPKATHSIAENPSRETVQTDATPFTAEQEKRHALLLEAIGGIDGEIAPGVTLYEHQKEAVHFLMHYERAIIGDHMGLGKTLSVAIPAKAWQKLKGWPIYVIAPATVVTVWERTAKQLDINIRVFSWDKLRTMKFGALDWPHPFILIVDEAHKGKNPRSQRSKAYLHFALHKNARVVYQATGTPEPNGRPIERYNMLLVAHHPLVWSESAYTRDEKKRAYELRYCDAHNKKIGNDTKIDAYGNRKKVDRYIWWNAGASQLRELHERTMYHVRQKNHRDVCAISRKKSDVALSLPEETRILEHAIVSPAAKKQFYADLDQMWEEYEDRKEEKLQRYIAEWQEKTGKTPDGDRIERWSEGMEAAEAMISYGFFRKAAAFAKLDSVYERAQEILENEDRVVIFSNYPDVLQRLGTRFQEAKDTEQEAKVFVDYIIGGMTQKQKDTVIDAFQKEDNKKRVLLATAAGGTGITLTAASYLIVIDRPWEPGEVGQWEGRIHRIGSRFPVTYYWIQMPESITEVDVKADAALTQKQQNIDMSQFGKQTNGILFTAFATMKKERRKTK